MQEPGFPFNNSWLFLFLLNFLYAGNLSTFAPVSYMDRSKITLIRPLIDTPEKEIKKFVKRNMVLY